MRVHVQEGTKATQPAYLRASTSSHEELFISMWLFLSTCSFFFFPHSSGTHAMSLMEVQVSRYQPLNSRRWAVQSVSQREYPCRPQDPGRHCEDSSGSRALPPQRAVRGTPELIPWRRPAWCLQTAFLLEEELPRLPLVESLDVSPSRVPGVWQDRMGRDRTASLATALLSLGTVGTSMLSWNPHHNPAGTLGSRFC